TGSGSGSLRFNCRNAGTFQDDMTITPTGFVGIGTVAPLTTLDVRGSTSTAQIIGNSAAPTIVAGAAAGAGPTVSITGNNMAGHISITTGTSTTASAVLATVTWAGSPLSQAPQSCPFIPVGTNATGQDAMVSISYPSTTGFTINVA